MYVYRYCGLMIYFNVFIVGRTEPNLDDLGLTFQYMNIDIQELAEYVKNVDSVPCSVQVPQYPVQRENHLNFLKPGSREVVTRPVHIHEHLPAMYPDTEGNKLFFSLRDHNNINYINLHFIYNHNDYRGIHTYR